METYNENQFWTTRPSLLRTCLVSVKPGSYIFDVQAPAGQGLTHAASLGWLSVMSSQCKPREDVVWLLSFPALGLSQSVNVMRKYAAPRQPGLIETKRFLVSTETALGARFAWLGTGPVASTANQSCASCMWGPSWTASKTKQLLEQVQQLAYKQANQCFC